MTGESGNSRDEIHSRHESTSPAPSATAVARVSQTNLRSAATMGTVMRFGLFFQAPEADGQSHAQRYAEMFELVALADTLGFDVAWLAELHFGGAFSLLANPLMMVPVIAQRTRRIRIGTAVTLLPLQHPLTTAEQAATADVLSGGRLEFGVGRGSIPSQFHGFRVPVAENRARFDEALEIIRLAWTKERFSHHGAFWDVEDVSV